MSADLNVSRVTVSKWVGQLERYGLQVNKVKGRGYRLVSPIDLLSKSSFLTHFSSEVAPHLSTVNFVPETISTNNLALQAHYEDSRWKLFGSEYQESGKGRRGKQWQSQFGANLLFSMGRKLHWSPDVLYMASLVSGLALTKTLSGYVIDPSVLKVKWPNDIYLDGKKLSGILCELQGSALDEALLVVGIGINVFEKPNDIELPSAKLSDYSSTKIDRNQLLAKITSDVIDAFDEAILNGTASVLKDWQSYDFLRGKEVRIILGDREEFGTACGINEKGELQIKSSSGDMVSYNGGEVSVRW